MYPFYKNTESGNSFTENILNFSNLITDTGIKLSTINDLKKCHRSLNATNYIK